jgi:hypothetical protein
MYSAISLKAVHCFPEMLPHVDARLVRAIHRTTRTNRVVS